MKTKSFEYNIVGNAQVFALSLVSLLRAANDVFKEGVDASVLDTLKVGLVRVGVTGVQQLDSDSTKECYYSISENTLTISLAGLEVGTTSFRVSATYGTNTQVLCYVFVNVTTAEPSQNDPIEVELAVVSTITPKVEQTLNEESRYPISGAAVATGLAPVIEAAEAYNVGKTQLAAAITSKGVETSPTETYPEMAEKVNAISQETYQINGGEMYAKQLFGSLTTPNYWNLYEVLAQLLSDGRLVNYGGILLAEYYKGYNSLALSGAGAGGAYVVSDKDGDGNFIMYTNDTTHTWYTEDDGKGNRWVAYCFADEYHDFQITDTNTSPRSIFIGRKVGTITSLVNGRLSKIVVPDGNYLVNFQNGSGFAQNWDKSVVLRNFENVNSAIFTARGNEESLYLSAKKISSNIFNAYTNHSTVVIDCPDISGTLFTFSGSNPYILKTLIIKNEDSSYKIINDSGNLPQLKQLSLFDAEGCTVLNHSTYETTDCVVYIHYKSNDKQRAVSLTIRTGSFNGWRAVKDVVLKNGWCKPLDIAYLINIIEDGATNNITEHILKRLKQDEPDCGDGVTITLGATNLAKLTSAESVQLLDDLTNIYGYTFA